MQEKGNNGSFQNSRVDKLDRQAERGAFYVQETFSRFADKINEIQAVLQVVMDALIQHGVLEPAKTSHLIDEVFQKISQNKEGLHPEIALRVDQENVQIELVNCEERLHICKAVCCKMDFALSTQEVESGKIKWDLGRPYFIRREKEGYCTHISHQQKCCTIYNDRPLSCRSYSCANDPRIWKDFEKMELNEEGIKKNLADKKVRLRATSALGTK